MEVKSLLRPDAFNFPVRLKWQDVVGFWTGVYAIWEGAAGDEKTYCEEVYRVVSAEVDRLREQLQSELAAEAGIPRWRFWRRGEIRIHLDTSLTPSVAAEFLALLSRITKST